MGGLLLLHQTKGIWLKDYCSIILTSETLVLAFLRWFCRKGISLSLTERKDKSSFAHRMAPRMAESNFRNIKSFCISIISLNLNSLEFRSQNTL